MVLTSQCSYSGRPILPGYGKRYSRNDRSLVIFLNRKCGVHYLSKWNPRKIRWTLAFRRAHGKEVVVKARENVTRKAIVSNRGFVGADQSKLDSLRQKYSASK